MTVKFRDVLDAIPRRVSGKDLYLPVKFGDVLDAIRLRSVSLAVRGTGTACVLPRRVRRPFSEISFRKFFFTLFLSRSHSPPRALIPSHHSFIVERGDDVCSLPCSRCGVAAVYRLGRAWARGRRLDGKVTLPVRNADCLVARRRRVSRVGEPCRWVCPQSLHPPRIRHAGGWDGTDTDSALKP